MTPLLQAHAHCATQVVAADGEQLSAARAVLFVLEEIGFYPGIARLARQYPFIWPIELVYRIVARNRSIFGQFFCSAANNGNRTSPPAADLGMPL
jgi:hypothetical protein